MKSDVGYLRGLKATPAPSDEGAPELIDHPTARALAEKARGASLKALEEAFSLIHFETLELAAQWFQAARQRDF
jgi:hypothetical protein